VARILGLACLFACVLGLAGRAMGLKRHEMSYEAVYMVWSYGQKAFLG
jgi:hypothetical protein